MCGNFWWRLQNALAEVRSHILTRVSRIDDRSRCRSAFPLLADFENLEGSLVRGMLRQGANAPPLPPPEPGTEVLLKKVEGSRIWSLERGLADLPRGVHRWLDETGNVDFRCGVECTRLNQREGGAIAVELTDGEVHALSQQTSRDCTQTGCLDLT